MKLNVVKLPAKEVAVICEPLVLIHGWGADSKVWEPLISELNQYAELWLIDLPGFGSSPVVDDYSPNNIVNLCLNVAPPRAIYLGWSLGGMIATKIAADFPGRVSALITLGTNLSFVSSAQWPTAMAADTFEKFYQGFTEDENKTLKRFYALQAKGDLKERELLKSFRSGLTDIKHNKNWLQALSLLSQLDNRVGFASLKQPGLHLFGETDSLVPASAAGEIQALNGTQKVEIMAEVGHAIHCSQPCSLSLRIKRFLEQEKYHLDKTKVAESFSRAATTYDSVASLQRFVGEQLIETYCDATLIQKLQQPGSTLLDIGSGTGFFTDKLRCKFPQSHVIGLDIAEGMLRYAKNEKTSLNSWVCGDAESLPLQTQSVDLIFSSLAIQWCENLTELMKEFKRVLKPDGKVILSTLGPETLHELRTAWKCVDAFAHVNQFIEREKVNEAVVEAGFVQQVWKSESRVLQYRQLKELTHELKALGAHNINTGRISGLTGRKKIQTLRHAYEQFRTDGMLPATYDVFYLQAVNPL